MDTQPEKLICERTYDEWEKIVEEFNLNWVGLIKKHSLTYVQLNYVIGWMITWAAEYISVAIEKDKQSENQ